MKIYGFLSFCLMLGASVVMAEGRSAVESPIKVVLSKEFCEKLLLDHKPQKDVRYQAGVDVDGNSVVPADINAFEVPLPEKIRIPVTIQKQFMYKTQSSGTTMSQGTMNGTVAQVTQSMGLNTTTVNQTAYNNFIAGLGGAGAATPIGTLTIAQLNTLAGIISETTNSTGTSTGTIAGTTQSQGMIMQSGTATAVPSGTLKSPYVDEIPLGFVEYELKSGDMTYNGKKLSSKENKLLRQKCRTILEN